MKNKKIGRLLFLGSVSLVTMALGCGKASQKEGNVEEISVTSLELFPTYSSSLTGSKLQNWRSQSLTTWFQLLTSRSVNRVVSIKDLGLRFTLSEGNLNKYNGTIMNLARDFRTLGDLADAHLIASPKALTLAEFQSSLKLLSGFREQSKLALLGVTPVNCRSIPMASAGGVNQPRKPNRSGVYPKGYSVTPILGGGSKHKVTDSYGGTIYEVNRDSYGDATYVSGKLNRNPNSPVSDLEHLPVFLGDHEAISGGARQMPQGLINQLAVERWTECLVNDACSKNIDPKGTLEDCYSGDDAEHPDASENHRSEDNPPSGGLVQSA